MAFVYIRTPFFPDQMNLLASVAAYRVFSGDTNKVLITTCHDGLLCWHYLCVFVTMRLVTTLLVYSMLVDVLEIYTVAVSSGLVLSAGIIRVFISLCDFLPPCAGGGGRGVQS